MDVRLDGDRSVYHLRLGVMYYHTGGNYVTDKRFAQRELLQVMETFDLGKTSNPFLPRQLSFNRRRQA